MNATVSMKREMRARMRSKRIAAWDWDSLDGGGDGGIGVGEFGGEPLWSGWRGSEGSMGNWIGRALGLKRCMIAVL